MKLLLSPLVILLGMPTLGLAQTPSFGLKGGLTMTSLGGSRIVVSRHRSGLTVGAFASIPINAAFAIQPEVLYSRKGAESAAYDYDAFPQDGDAPPIGAFLAERTSHDYLELPVLLKLSPASPRDVVRPSVFAGPALGVLLGARKVYGVDYQKNLRSTDLGLTIGGLVELGRFSLDARYNLGLTPVEKDYDAAFGRVAAGVKNRALAVSAGFRVF